MIADHPQAKPGLDLFKGKPVFQINAGLKNAIGSLDLFYPQGRMGKV
jgi:hypothetical protein